MYKARSRQITQQCLVWTYTSIEYIVKYIPGEIRGSRGNNGNREAAVFPSIYIHILVVGSLYARTISIQHIVVLCISYFPLSLCSDNGFTHKCMCSYVHLAGATNASWMPIRARKLFRTLLKILKLSTEDKSS